MITALKIHVTGIVQGVGFRPFIYRQAQRYVIKGWVLNSADGVHIHAEGEEKLVDEFCMSISNDAPAASKVEAIEMQEVPLENFETFEIRHSEDKKTSKAGSQAGQTLISPDLATCEDCVRELFDKNDRRYRYPFINCTNCGPRFTIIEKLPYDRPLTSMKEFKMCDICDAEYKDPGDRRFHAQPDACFDCGPQISWTKTDDVEHTIYGDTIAHSDAIFAECVDFLLKGNIVAIKGLGGFHLACDASNDEAVKKLRKRKMRSNKAFAIMTQDISDVEKICKVNDTEKSLLTGSARPIVLMQKKPESKKLLSDNTCMGLPEIGVMLPYTPVQHILLNDFKKAGGKYLVMTSGNIYDNPILTDDELAKTQLSKVADAFLGNNRKILARYDDSVVRVIDAAGIEAVQMIRRARGYAPSPIKITIDEPGQVFATGPEQKNTFAFSRKIETEQSSSKNAKNTEVFLSQHIGDVENAEVFGAWDKAREQIGKIFKFKPEKICRDLHPEYLTSKWAGEQNCKVETMQHHYAHVLSTMLENELEGPVLGFAFDGTGYGIDGHIWGGEVMLCNTHDFERFANFSYVPMPGGSAAIKDPMRMAYGVLWASDLLEHKATTSVFKEFDSDTMQNMNSMIEQGINTPMTSSVGRLFDAASAILNICPKPTYEGEAAIMLEARLWDYISDHNVDQLKYDKKYDIKVTKNIATDKSTARDTSVVLLDVSDSFKAMLDDLLAGVDEGFISYNFHMAFVNVIVACSQMVKQLYGIDSTALSGGVFMNRFLIENSIKALTDSGFNVAVNKEVPPNDGGISLAMCAV